jgi:hypothetical protein
MGRPGWQQSVSVSPPLHNLYGFGGQVSMSDAHIVHHFCRVMSMKSFQANMSGQVTDGFVTASPITSLPSLKAMLHSAASRTSLSKYSAKSSGVDPALAACSTELHRRAGPRGELQIALPATWCPPASKVKMRAISLVD